MVLPYLLAGVLLLFSALLWHGKEQSDDYYVKQMTACYLHIDDLNWRIQVLDDEMKQAKQLIGGGEAADKAAVEWLVPKDPVDWPC